jgi:carbonic anhydrase
MKKTKFLLLLGIVIMIGGTRGECKDGHWGYIGNSGPEHWGELDQKFAVCSSGKNQSPINLKNFIEADLPPIDFNYNTPATSIVNNGHTVKVDHSPGSTIRIDGRQFELKQLHFHAPSENHLEGKSFAMEAHFVHADTNGNLAVIGVMYDIGASNPAIEALWQKMPKQSGDRHMLTNNIRVTDLLPRDKSYYRFNGSLTTPPCSEGVRWLVMKRPITVSTQQLKTFEQVMRHPNNRNIQPINARTVLQ